MDSSPQEDAEGRAIVRVLAVVLERLVSANSHLAVTDQEETKFHALRAPAIGILQYLERIHKYASCSKECFILALIYIDRLIQRNGFLLTDLNVHRVVITAVLLAAKFFDDAYYNNAYYAKVGGVLVAEMNALEVEFLFKIDFGLRVLPEMFDKYRGELVSHSSAMGMDRIARCTDEELFCRQQQRNQQARACATLPQVMPQAPSLQTYSQADLADPVLYNPTPVATAPLMQQEHYPIQALQSNLTAPAQPQAQGPGQGLRQGLGQQPTQPVQDQALFPFPNLVAQVSTQQQPMALPVRGPSELDLVYHNITPAAAPQQMPARYAAPQDASLSQYAQAKAVSQEFVSPQPYAPQAQTQQAQTQQGAGLGHQFPSQSHLQAAEAQARAATTELGYYSAPAAACANIMAQTVTQTPTYMAPAAQQMRPSALQRLPSYPEITPSPPPQPTTGANGAPAIGAYRPAGEGGPGCASQHVGHLASGAAAYLNSATAALHAQIQGGMYAANEQQQAASHIPLAVAVGHDAGPGGVGAGAVWPLMLIERRVTDGSAYS